jgi:thiol-disulfide isomerase/thioredoxin
MNKINFITVLLLTWMISVATVKAYDNVQTKTLLIFSADWCKHCQTVKEDLVIETDLIEMFKNYEIIFLDFDVDKDAVNGYNIKALPTFVILHDNKEVNRQIGYKGGYKKLIQFLN